jgi:hypothetical protein
MNSGIAEQLVSDEYQVVEFGPLGGEIGPVSSGHFPAGDDPATALVQAVHYAALCRQVVAPCLGSYRVRRVQVFEVIEP